MKVHIVQKGDTLWKIAKMHHVPFEEVKKANAHLANPDYIVPGMKVFVPVVVGKSSYEEKQQPPVPIVPVLDPDVVHPSMSFSIEAWQLDASTALQESFNLPPIQAPLIQAPPIQAPPVAPLPTCSCHGKTEPPYQQHPYQYYQPHYTQQAPTQAPAYTEQPMQGHPNYYQPAYCYACHCQLVPITPYPYCPPFSM